MEGTPTTATASPALPWPPPPPPGLPLHKSPRTSAAAAMSIVSGAAAWLLFAVSTTGTYDRYSRAAFALALKASLLAIGLAVAGFERSKRPDRKGRGLAVAGLTLGMLPYVLPVLLIIWLILNGTNRISG